MDFKSLSKGELATKMGISSSTLTRYLKNIEKKLPNYNKTQHILTPRQVKVILEHYCV